MDTKKFIESNLIVKHLAGSHAYGMALPTSDIDYRGIFCADPINVRTPFFPVKEVVDADEEDTKFYELSHFMKLVTDCNPNILETLWVDEKDVIIASPGYWRLRNHRKDLLSSKVAFTFSGYAIAQLNRIKGHQRWINNPQPKQRPVPAEFVSLVQNFTSEKVFKISLYNYAEGYKLIPYGNDLYGIVTDESGRTIAEDGSLIADNVIDYEQRKHPLYIVKFNKQQYERAVNDWKNYWTWKNNRNKARAELEEHHGFDTKHAAHLVRLLRMGKEILETGEVIVKRPDALELLEIRQGKWTYNEIIEYSEYMDDLIRNKLYKTTSLPKKPNLKKAAALLMEVQDMMWENN